MTDICFIKLKDEWRAEKYSDPPIGLLSVISSAKKINSLEVKLLDMTHEIEIPESDFYGLSACTLNYPELLSIAERIKKEYNGKVIVGGAHFDAFDEEHWNKEIKTLPIDIITRGEGEYTLPIAIKELNEGKKVISQKELLDLDTLDIPSWDILNKNKYLKNGSGTIMTSRGCPYNCSFCASPTIHKKKVRFRSVENVEKEIDFLQKNYGIKHLRFQDDCFSINRSRFKKLAEMIKSKNITYRCSLRTDHVDDETLDLLKYSGCNEIGVGIEASEDNILSLLNKKTTVEINKQALLKLKDFGFKTRAFCMTGLPQETERSAEYMINFFEKTSPEIITLTTFTPLPGSDIYNNPEKYGIKIIDNNFNNYNIAIKLDKEAPFVHRLSTATLAEMERNREMLKEYIFNHNKSNVSQYNKPYKSEVLK